MDCFGLGIDPATAKTQKENVCARMFSVQMTQPWRFLPPKGDPYEIHPIR